MNDSFPLSLSLLGYEEIRRRRRRREKRAGSHAVWHQEFNRSYRIEKYKRERERICPPSLLFPIHVTPRSTVSPSTLFFSYFLTSPQRRATSRDDPKSCWGSRGTCFPRKGGKGQGYIRHIYVTLDYTRLHTYKKKRKTGKTALHTRRDDPHPRTV